MTTPGPSDAPRTLGRLWRLGAPVASSSGHLDRLVSPIRRPFDRAWFARNGRLSDLERLGDSVSRTRPAIDGKRVLVLSLRMWTHHTAYEFVITQALRLRGADVSMLTCGGGQPICEVGWGRKVAPRPCDRCAYYTDGVASRAGVPQVRLADEFPWGSSPSQAPSDLDAGDALSSSDSALASVAWFTKSGDAAQAEDGAAIGKDFAVSVAAVEDAFGRVLDRVRPDVVFALNGLFGAERAVRAVAADRGVRVVTYEMGLRSGTLLFGEASAAPDMEMDALAGDQRSRPLSNEEGEALDQMLLARVAGSGAHERYFEQPQRHDDDAVRAALSLDPETRVISAFTNLAWDTALVGKDLAFESQFDWLARACGIVAGLDQTVLVIRVHPAESRWGTAQPVEEELLQRLGELPQNVLLVRPDDPLSSYGLMAISDLVLCYTTTVGLEAAVKGIPVAVAGQTHYRARGFTIDVETHADLERAIAELPAMSPERVELARRYAFAFFFRLMIPFGHVRNVDGRLDAISVTADDLLPTKDPYLDFICDLILEGGDAFLPPELAVPGADSVDPVSLAL